MVSWLGSVKTWWFAVAITVLSTLSGGIYVGYDTVQRFYAVENSVAKVQGVNSKVQSLEQTIADNDVKGLNTKLAALSVNMNQILEQQKLLLNLRSQVEKSTTITDSIGDKLDKYSTEIDDIWKAYDSLVKNPLNN